MSKNIETFAKPSKDFANIFRKCSRSSRLCCRCLPAKPVLVFSGRAATNNKQQQTTNNNEQLNGLREHISEIFGAVGTCGDTHFVIGFAGIWHKREKNRKKSEKFRKRPNASERFPTYSERVRMHPSRSEQVPARLRTSEKKLRKLANNRENIAKFRENVAKVSRNSRLCRRCFSHPWASTTPALPLYWTPSNSMMTTLPFNQTKTYPQG